jgi:hypothetical protein
MRGIAFIHQGLRRLIGGHDPGVPHPVTVTVTPIKAAAERGADVAALSPEDDAAAEIDATPKVAPAKACEPSEVEAVHIPVDAAAGACRARGGAWRGRKAGAGGSAGGRAGGRRRAVRVVGG